MNVRMAGNEIVIETGELALRIVEQSEGVLTLEDNGHMTEDEESGTLYLTDGRH